MTNVLLLPEIDGPNTKFAIPNNADWVDSLFFGAPGFGPAVVLSPCSMTSGSNNITVPSTVGIQPGMQISTVPGLSGAYVGSITSATILTSVGSNGIALNATATTVEAQLTFNPAPLDLTGIGFIANLRQQPGAPQIFLNAQTANGTMINYGPTGVLAFNVPVATMNGVTPATYFMDILAIADGHTINVIPNGPCTVVVSPGISNAQLFL